MLLSYRRAALLTGASFSALLLATPVLATPVETPQSLTESVQVQAAATGLRQDDSGTIAINLFELQETDPALVFSAIDSVTSPGAPAVASAEILCAELSSACTQPGAVEQVANGTSIARNELVIGGELTIGALAAATGATATAIARIDTAIMQQAISGGGASNSVDVSGSIDIIASAEAVATDGPAMALAAITQAMVLSATGATSAAIDLTNSGSVSIAGFAEASAHEGSDPAVAGAIIFGIDAFASVTSDGPASIAVTNDGSIVLDAEAHAAAPGLALASAAALAGINATALAVQGDAAIAIDNAGAFSLSAAAEATGGQTGFAVANANGALIANANGFGAGDASAAIVNSGSLTLDAAAQAQATNNAIAIAIAGSAILNAARAATGDALVSIDNVGLIEILADAAATGLLAQATVIAGGGPFTGAVVQTAFAISGDASALLANDGAIIISGHAEANGSDFATAVAFGGPGVVVRASNIGGGNAHADIVNTGSILLTVDADAVAANAAAANAIHLNGLVASALAGFAGLDGEASVNLVNNDMVVLEANAHALADDSAFGHARVERELIADASAFGTGDAQAVLVNSGSIEIGANATATGATAFAIATATNVIVEAGQAFGGGLGQAELVNDGTLVIDATASAKGVIATAGAFFDQGIDQAAGGAAGADALLNNSGSIELTSLALAESDTGSAFAVATAAGIVQAAAAVSTSITSTIGSGGTFELHLSSDPSGPASLHLENQGSFSLAAQAGANGGTDAQAQAVIAGASQSANGLTMDVSLTNSGAFAVAAIADASASGLADAVAQAAGIQQAAAGIAQVTTVFFTASGVTSNTSTSVVGSAMVQLENSGSISVAAMAEAAGGTFAIADAAATGIAQAATGTAGAAQLDNSGMIAVMAIGQATGTNVGVLANAVGVDQLAFADDGAAVSLSNSGSFIVLADATVDGDTLPNGLADAIGVLQSPESANGSAEVINEGTLTVAARVEGSGGNGAGQAHAVGIEQIPFLGEYTARLDNGGKLNVLAEVMEQVDAGGSAIGLAQATGYLASGHSIMADVSNDGTISVLASVDAVADAGFAQANAVGLDIVAFADSAVAGVLEGVVVNSGMLFVGAEVAGGGTQASGSGVAALSQASATGIRLASGSIDATVTNSGSIMIEAISASGGDASAVGILATDSGIVGDGTATLTINNSGDLIVRQSTDGGTTWQRGTAIDLSTAPNQSIVNLLGGGVIYGDVALQDGDQVNVQNGATYFNGIINPSFVPAGGLTAADLDSGLFGVAALSVRNGGMLIIGDPHLTGPANMYDGPSYAFVETLDVAAGGALMFELQPTSAGAQPVGTYSQLFADTANLAGTLVANVTTANGLLADSYSWDNVIDANTRSGQFSQCRVSGSVLLSLQCVYDGNANVDLTLTRVAFGAVGGLNRNGTAAGDGLESIYSPSLTGGIADLFADLFQISDGDAYNIALNQLSGSSYANYLQSFSSLGVRYNDLVDHGADCEGQPLEGSALSCRAPSSIQLWGQLDLQRQKASGDVEAGTTRSGRFTTLVGLDAYVGNSFLVGVSGGVGNNHTRDRQFGDLVDGDGTLLGAYAVYDPGAFYVKGITTYSRFDGDSGRRINFQGLAPALSFSARPEADPDVKLFTAGLHAGARLPVAANSVVTPYVNLDYVHARLDDFTEAGSSGAELSVAGGKANRTFVSSGVKWSGRIGDVIPEATVGYRHRFGSSRSTIRAAFLTGSGSDFDIISAAQDRGSLLAGLSLGGTIGRVGLRVSYDGEFNDDVTGHSGNFKLVLPLGGSGKH